MTAQELFDTLLPRLASAAPPSDTFIGALNNAIDVISRRLMYRRSQLLIKNATDDIAVGDEAVALPPDYCGFDGRPKVGNTDLTMLPPGMRNTFDSPGSPQYYDLIGGRLNIYPTAVAAATIKYSYFARPEKLTQLADDIPWYGLLDSIIGEALVEIGRTGQWSSVTAQWELFIGRQVDLLLRMYAPGEVTLMSVNRIAR